MNDSDLTRALRALDREREPAHDLWPRIAAAIDTDTMRAARMRPRRRPRWTLPLALAASALLASVLLFSLRPTDPAAPPPPPIADAAPIDPHGARMLRQADALSIEYRVALAQLDAGPLPPELRRVARELRESEQALRQALREHPHSTWLLGQLRRTYEQQLRLTQIAALG